MLATMDEKIGAFHKKFQADLQREISSTLQAGFDATRNMVEMTCNSLRTEVSALSKLVQDLVTEATKLQKQSPPVPAAPLMEDSTMHASTILDPHFSAMETDEAKTALAPFTKVMPITRKTSQTPISAFTKPTINPRNPRGKNQTRR
jgi:hypothetical protein